jgi:teichuronic acid biosynthesis glycosyltransferase TuaG
MSLVSIIIPYYKKIHYIEKTIHSILNQTYKKIEVIIVYDDQDLDDYKTIKKLIKNDKRFKLILNNKNLGAGPSRNKGIEMLKENI